MLRVLQHAVICKAALLQRDQKDERFARTETTWHGPAIV
jgi:hypothetical protein